jgi:hypothetical protein
MIFFFFMNHALVAETGSRAGPRSLWEKSREGSIPSQCTTYVTNPELVSSI